MTQLGGSAHHVYLMPTIWRHINARKPKWAKAHDLLNVAEQMCGLAPPAWGQLLFHTAKQKGE